MKFINENIGQWGIYGNVFYEIPWQNSKLSISCFISKRLADFAGEIRCEACNSHLVFGSVCQTCCEE